MCRENGGGGVWGPEMRKGWEEHGRQSSQRGGRVQQGGRVDGQNPSTCSLLQRTWVLFPAPSIGWFIIAYSCSSSGFDKQAGKMRLRKGK